MHTNDVQTRSTTSGSTSASLSNGFSSRADSSGGVRLNGGGTIYNGSASNMGSSRAAPTSASVTPSLNTQTSSRAGYSSSVASSGAAINPNGYGSPGRRSPTGSVARASTARSGSVFPKIKKTPAVVDTDAVRQQHKDMRHQAAKKSKEKADGLEVPDSESD